MSDDTQTSAQVSVNKALYLSHFTPSMMAPETLEAMLVQRGPLLQRSLDNVVDSLRTGSSHHTLFVGPRGIGKTHLISLLHHRLAGTTEAQNNALVAWMREEEWGVTSFFELVMRILRTLDTGYPELQIETCTAPLYDLPLKEAEKLAESILLETLGTKRLVVLLENLDDLFDQLGEQGQKAWRAFIQNHNNMVLVCTTPALFAGVSLQKSAFYGFFDIEALKELDFDDVVSLLSKIAVERGDHELAAFIATSEGRARIRAVHHLAEGNPRIYIIFAQFLSAQALDELVPAFMHTLDELTPYYQARMKELSGQQRKIVEYLVNYRGAAPVKQIAKTCFITQQTCSSQLKQLKEKRYVRSIEQGRESYYELCEPLMRLCMEVKKQRGEPIGLFVEMLQIWYGETELQKWLETPHTQQGFDLRYVEKALEGLKKQVIEPKLNAQLKELRRCDGAGARKAIYEEIAKTKSSNATSALLRAATLLTGARWPELCPTIRSELDDLKNAHEFFLADAEKTLTRQNALEVYLIAITNHYALHNLDPEFAEKTLSRVAQLLVRLPAHAVASLMCPEAMGDTKAYQKWLTLVTREVFLGSSAASGKRARTVWSRMFAAMRDFGNANDEKVFLSLPTEERKLLIPLAKQLFPKSIDSSVQ
jgi:DNA-binding transcriptional ArsR family regulator